MSVSLCVQSVIYGNNSADLLRSFDYLIASIKTARTAASDFISVVHIVWGDCSPLPRLSEHEIQKAMSSAAKVNIQFEYHFFSRNLGSAGGHNNLFSKVNTDFILILNPDTIISPNAISNLLETCKNQKIGIAEARQIPIEHPKYFDPSSLDTSWASTACALVRRDACELINGFDSESFFLYCDDVDFSWRMRLNNFRVVFRPDAVVFHDKRLSADAKWIATATEEYYSAEAALLLAHKYSRNDLVDTISKDFFSHGSAPQKKALAEFDLRKQQNRLAKQIDNDHRVAQFTGGYYAKHRF